MGVGRNGAVGAQQDAQLDVGTATRSRRKLALPLGPIKMHFRPDTEYEHADRVSMSRLIAKVCVLGFGIILLTYLKLLWPLIFGRMESEGVSFLEAISDAKLHVSALVFFVCCVVAGVVYTVSKNDR